MSELCDNDITGQSQWQSMSGSRGFWKPHVLPRKYLKQGEFDNKQSLLWESLLNVFITLHAG